MRVYQRMFEAGQLDKRVEIHAPSKTTLDTGETEFTYALTATRYGAINPISGQEFISSDRQLSEVTHRVTLRHFSGLTNEHRLKYGSRTFEVIFIRDPETRGELMEILCKESN